MRLFRLTASTFLVCLGVLISEGSASAAPLDIRPPAAIKAAAPAISRPAIQHEPYAPGTIVINTRERRLYFMLAGGEVIRYPIGVGRVGFTWGGITSVERKQEWPSWSPPEQMLRRQPYLPRWMAGGPKNPLGARALYLANTLYRIHGTNEPESIGHAVSSGCFRMHNDHVIDLYNRVTVGARVVVVQ